MGPGREREREIILYIYTYIDRDVYLTREFEYRQAVTAEVFTANKTHNSVCVNLRSMNSR